MALAQAAVAMNLWGYNYSRYRQLLTERALDEVVRREDGDPYPTKVGAALRIAYTGVLDHLDATAPVVGVAARALLSGVSLMAESGVPRDWLYVVGDDEHAAREAVGELLGRSVLSESQDSSVVSLHRLQGQVIREDQATSQELDPVRTVVDILAAVERTTPVDYLKRRELCSLLGSQLVAIHAQEHSRALLDDPALLAILGR